MRITGLITEYNPFHNGHLHHLRESRRITEADYLVVLMSGSHVQRGEPAVFDKYARAKMALLAGADLVLEMPAAFSTASAMEFASYGVALFTALGAVDSIVFGSECGNLTMLSEAAGLLCKETDDFKQIIQQCLKEGFTYPQARTEALLQTLDVPPAERGELQSLLTSPNNILGIEYLMAGMRMNSPIRFYTIPREGAGYHDTALNGNLSSASAIRNVLYDAFFQADKKSQLTDNKKLELLAPHIPECCLPALMDEVPVFSSDYSLLLQDRILNEEWNNISDLNTELIARLKKTGNTFLSYKERVHLLKSRQYTYTRVSRALLHMILGIRENDLRSWKNSGYAPYARILGFRRDSSALLKELKLSSQIPLLTKVADASSLLPPEALSMLEQEIRASHLYQSVRAMKGGRFKNEYTEGILLL